MAIKKLGKYEILTKLGEGATAEVYQARDTMLGRDVSLKVLKPALVTDASAFARFVNEAQVAASLFHPHIATVLDMGESKGRYFITARYIPGRSLDRVILEDGPFPWEEVVRMTMQLGDALNVAHRAGYIHRDIKPSNIICSTDKEYVLTDFGLVLAMVNTGLTSHTGAMIGTPEYIAPEIWNGSQASQASDQYALACVVFEVVTGEVLFQGSTTQEIVTNHLIKEPAIPDTWGGSVPPEFSIVLRKALDKDPTNRFESINNFARAIEKLENLTYTHPILSNPDHYQEQSLIDFSDQIVEDTPITPQNNLTQYIENGKRYSQDLPAPYPLNQISQAAVASFISGILGLSGVIFLITLPLAPVAVIFGHFALFDIGKSQGTKTGSTWAWLGLGMGYGTMLFFACALFFWLTGDQLLNIFGTNQ